MMKLKSIIIFILLALFMPCLSLLKTDYPIKKEQSEKFKIFDESKNEIIEVSDKDFLIGAIACEMPLSFENEALKAQGVAAYTHYSKLRNESKDEYDFAVNTKDFYIYTDTENMKSRFGENFDEYHSRLSEIADEIYKKAVTYQGELITAVYFAISSGNTENCEDIFVGALPYLKACASPWDAYCEGFCEKKDFTLSEINEILKNKNLSPCESANELFGEIRRSKSGSVISAIMLGDETDGGEIRNMFSLRSQNFNIIAEKEKISFITKGYGHGVGMSQVGANELAKQGYSYESILKWYYKDCEISDLK